MRVSEIARDAIKIWQAGVEAVRADRVLRDTVRWDGRWLHVDGEPYDLRGIDRIIVVGAGKASCGMLVGLSDALRASGVPLPMVLGWVQIPEGSVDPRAHDLDSLGSWRVEICEARPRGVNEPTEKVVAGTREILRLVESAGPNDCVILLLSGGGSALLCLPVDEISLASKIEVTRSLSALGASIVPTESGIEGLSYVWSVHGIVLLLAIVWLLPNSQQLLAGLDPILEKVEQPARWQLHLTFTGGLILALPAVLVLRTFLGTQASPFLYFNF